MSWQAGLGGVLGLAIAVIGIVHLIRESRKGIRSSQVALLLFGASFVVPLVKLLQCVLQASEDATLIECVYGFIVIPFVAGAMAIVTPVLMPWRIRISTFQTFWYGVGGVLDPGHEHGQRLQPDSGRPGFTLLGTYKGRSVEACSEPYFDEWAYSARYEVCLRAGGSGSRWKLVLWPGPLMRPGSWRVISESKELERKLEGAGLTAAAEGALGLKQPHLLGITCADGRLCWVSDNSEPPDVEQFRRFLDFLVWLVPVNDRLNS